jgi:ABC-type methionine transport system ATPase subunit
MAALWAFGNHRDETPQRLLFHATITWVQFNLQEGKMADQTIRLVYPSTMVNVPVINQLIRNFDVTVNIVGAQITGGEGWIDIQISGDDPSIRNALAWLDSQGIEVNTILD